jgi:hypothetical protein
MSTGHKKWIIPGGHIPGQSTGAEPASTSRDVLCLVNTNEQDAQLNIMIYYEDHDPKGPYTLTVKAKRIRHIRFNDLIDPESIPLDTPYAALIKSNIPVVVQFTRVDTSRNGMAVAMMMAYPAS